jgi:excisionase family DNA binding protein
VIHQDLGMASEEAKGMTMRMLDREFFSPEEIAQWLGISAYTVCELCRRGKIQHARVGRRIRIKRQWAEEYMMASARAPRI